MPIILAVGVALLAAILGGCRVLPRPSAPTTEPPAASSRQTAHPTGWLAFTGQGVLGLADPRTGRTVQAKAASCCRWQARTSDGVLLGAPGQALRWDPARGGVQPAGIHLRVPHGGTMYTGMEAPTAVGSPGDFALCGFHGGGVGDVFQIYTPGFSPDPAYSWLRSPPDTYFGLQFACNPPVLAGAPEGRWLLRGAVGYQSGPTCAYGVLSPGGRIRLDASLNAWKGRAQAAAFSPGGHRLALLTASGGLWLSTGGAAPVRLAGLPVPSCSRGTAPPGTCPPPAALEWSPGGGYLVAGFGGDLQLFRISTRVYKTLSVVVPAAGYLSWTWLPGKPQLPRAADLAAAEARMEAAGKATVLLVGAPAGTPPAIRVTRTTAAGTRTLPVDRWNHGQGDYRWCLVSRGSHPSGLPWLTAAAQHDWVVLPPAGWLLPGRYVIAATWPGGSLTRRFGF